MTVDVMEDNLVKTDLMSHTATMGISLAYAPTANEQLYLEVRVAVGTQLITALEQVGWLNDYPELAAWCYAHKKDTKIDNKAWRVGVFSEKKRLTYVLKEQDRIEIYRPLTIEPMHKRKHRATQNNQQ